MFRKIIVALTLTCFLGQLQAQLSLNEMFAVYKMDLDKFESFALGKNYNFHEMKESDHTYGMTFVRGLGENTKYVTLYTRFFSYGKAVNMQTGKTTEYLNFRSQLQSQGFKPKSTENSDGSLKKIYIKGAWEVTTYSGNNDDGRPYHEIHLQKIESDK